MRMARFVGRFTMLALLVPQILATPCAEGSCTEDTTSFLQVQDIVKPGKLRDHLYNTPADTVTEADMEKDTGEDAGEEAADVRQTEDPDMTAAEYAEDAEVRQQRMQQYAPGGAVIESYENGMDNAGAEVQDQVARDTARVENSRALQHHVVSQVRNLQDATVAELDEDKASVEEALENRQAIEMMAARKVEEARKEAQGIAVEKRDVEDAAVLGHAVGETRAMEMARLDMHDGLRAAVLNGDREDGERDFRARALRQAQDQREAEASAYVAQTADQMERVKEDGSARAHLWREEIEGEDNATIRMIREDADDVADDYDHLNTRNQEEIDGFVDSSGIETPSDEQE